VVWWYGPLEKNQRNKDVPLVTVFFRQLRADGTLSSFQAQVQVALTYLGLLRIGSVWEDGMRTSTITYPEEKFDLDFSDGGWRLASLLEDESLRELFSRSFADGYPLYYPRDRNFLLDFRLQGGRRLLVPCMEFFTRCYGHSAEVRRVLTTYGWEEAEGRLFKPVDELVEPRSWPVSLGQRLHKDDAVFLAHVKHSQYTRAKAKGVNAQLMAAFEPFGDSQRYIFPEITPWFQGPAQLKAQGLWLEAGRTFLALRLTGNSQPKGETVVLNREQPGAAGGRDGDDELGPDTAVRHLRPLPEIVDLTSYEAPDHGAQPIDIEDDEMEILGEPRKVVDRKRAVDRRLLRSIPSDQAIRAVSTGEPHGSDKGVGYGAIHTPIALESHGMLRDMWNAACKLRELAPHVVRSVGWFTPDTGIRHDQEPRLVSLEPFGPDDVVIDNEVRTWIYYDWGAQILRGVLVMIIQAADKTVCLIEPQRRPVKSRKDAGKVAEESLSGMVFTLKPQDDLGVLIRYLLEQMRHKKGRAAQVIDALGWERPIFAFKHGRAKESYPCEAAIGNALGKVGVVVPKLMKEPSNS